MTLTKQTNILIISPDPVIMTAMDRFLARMSYSTDCATTALQALDRLDNQSYHLILLDLDLTDRNSFYLAEQVRQSEQAKGTHPSYLCAVTACDLDSIRYYCYHIGMDDVAAKPVTKHFIEHLIMKSHDSQIQLYGSEGGLYANS